MALEIATGTSRALPYPNPTRPAPSPTTVSAVNPNCLPPFTTFATRLTATSFSSRSSPDIGFSVLAILSPLELETRLAGGIRQRFHAAVVHEAGTVECNLADALRLGPLRDGATDGLGGLDVARGLQLAAHIFLHGRGGHQDLVAFRGEDLRINMPRRAVDGEPHRGELLDLHAAAQRAPQSRVFLVQLHVVTSFSPLSAKSFRPNTSRPCPCRAPAA